MNFDNHFGVGAVIEIVTLLVGLIGGWFTMRSNLKTTTDSLKELKADVDEDRRNGKAQHEQNVTEITAIKVQIANECLKKTDFQSFELRFDQKIKDIEHAANGAAMKAAGLMGDMLRTAGLLRGGRE